jgi:acyl-CoA synthetase (AMP-forming)/AMP-acid ligase II
MQKRWLSFLGIAMMTVVVVLLNRYYLPTLTDQQASVDSAWW